MRRPAPPRLPSLRPPAAGPSLRLASQGAAGVLVIAAGWGAGHGLAVGMDVAHCAATGFAISGSIFLAVLTCATPATAQRSARG